MRNSVGDQYRGSVTILIISLTTVQILKRKTYQDSTNLHDGGDKGFKSAVDGDDENIEAVSAQEARAHADR